MPPATLSSSCYPQGNMYFIVLVLAFLLFYIYMPIFIFASHSLPSPSPFTVTSSSVLKYPSIFFVRVMASSTTAAGGGPATTTPAVACLDDDDAHPQKQALLGKCNQYSLRFTVDPDLTSTHPHAPTSTQIKRPHDPHPTRSV